jgi:hypothetical protein
MIQFFISVPDAAQGANTIQPRYAASQGRSTCRFTDSASTRAAPSVHLAPLTAAPRVTVLADPCGRRLHGTLRVSTLTEVTRVTLAYQVVG